jgi:hypothetical protein
MTPEIFQAALNGYIAVLVTYIAFKIMFHE